jgi:uncharacterized protein YwgA
MKSREMEKKDWLLLMVSMAGDGGLTPVRLQKTLFLLGQQSACRATGFYKFTAYNYGPFCSEIYRDAESLEALKLIEIRREGNRWPEYFITPSGRKRIEELAATIPETIRNYASRLVNWAQALDFAGLVSAIYQAFPKFKAKSVFRE